jgi:hypothetical protein
LRQLKWKGKWIQQRKKDQRDPDLKTYKYTCLWGHIRDEKIKLLEPLPECPACAQEGKKSHFRFLGIHTMTRNDAKQSRFKQEASPSKKTAKSTGPRQKQNQSSQSIPIGSSCALYKTCRVCGEVKHFTEFQSKQSYTQRKNYCRQCKITGRVPGKSGDPKVLANMEPSS